MLCGGDVLVMTTIDTRETVRRSDGLEALG
jgi:hypothetical protein